LPSGDEVVEEKKRWQCMVHEIGEGPQAAGRRLQTAGGESASAFPFYDYVGAASELA